MFLTNEKNCLFNISGQLLKPLCTAVFSSEYFEQNLKAGREG